MPLLFQCAQGHQWELPSAVATLTETPACPLCQNAGRQRPQLSQTHDLATTPTLPRIEGYETVAILGRGGMGVVYKAKQSGLNRVVALKMVLAGMHAGPQELARFTAEAEAVAQLQHPNIVQVYEIGYHEGQPFFSLEYVDGGSLAQKLRGQPLAPRQAARLVEILARAMDYAHRRGIVHRDLKPGNILLQEVHDHRGGPSGPGQQPGVCPILAGLFQPKISDFGLAKRVGHDKQLTRTGFAVGTPAYMSPEQADGRDTRTIGPPADIYALGVILYELIAGVPPFQAANTLDLLNQVVGAEPPPPSKWRSGIPGDLETICLKCLRKDPAQRYASAADLADDLDRFQEGEPIEARPVRPSERVFQAVRKQPALTALAGLLFAVTVLAAAGNASNAVNQLMVYFSVIGFGGLIWQWRLADGSRKKAEEQRLQAETARREAEEHRQQAERARREAMAIADRAAAAQLQAESNLYSHQIALADREWLAGNVARADEVLEECSKFHRHWEWYFLKRLCHAERCVYRGHDDWVRGVLFHPDGRRLLTAGGLDRTVKVWDGATGQDLAQIRGHKGCVRGLALSPDGARVATVADDKTCRVHDADTGQHRLTLEGHLEPVLSAAFSPDGLLLATASTDRTARLWDAATGAERRILRGHGGTVYQAAFSPDGLFLATVSKDRTARLWDVAGGAELAVLTGHSDGVTGAAFSPDGRHLATVGGLDQTIKVWELASAERGAGNGERSEGSDSSPFPVPCSALEVREVFSVRGHTEAVWAVAYHPDGKHLATAGGDGTVKVWEAAGGRLLFTLRGHQGAVAAVAFSGDGGRLASAGTDRTARVWPALTPPEAVPLGSHPGVQALAFRKDGQQLASAGGDTGVKLWDFPARRTSATLTGPGGPAHALAFRGDGQQLLTAHQGGQVYLWDLQSNRPVLTFTGHTRAVVAAAYSPDGRRVASASQDGTLKVWDAATGAEAVTFRGHVGQLTAVAFTPDGRAVVSLSVDSVQDQAELKLWRPEGLKELLTLVLPRDGDEDAFLALAPGGKVLATASHGQTAKLWRLGDLAADPRGLRGHVRPIAAVAFTPDAKRIATASHDQTIKLWNPDTCQEVLTLRGNGYELTALAFSPDGRCLVSAGKDDVIRVWESMAGR